MSTTSNQQVMVDVGLLLQLGIIAANNYQQISTLIQTAHAQGQSGLSDQEVDAIRQAALDALAASKALPATAADPAPAAPPPAPSTAAPAA